MLCYAKSLKSCLTLCDPTDGSPPGCPIPGTLQARTQEWAAISFSNAWKWKVKVKSLSRAWLPATPMDCSLTGSPVHGKPYTIWSLPTIPASSCATVLLSLQASATLTFQLLQHALHLQRDVLSSEHFHPPTPCLGPSHSSDISLNIAFSVCSN